MAFHCQLNTKSRRICVTCLVKRINIRLGHYLQPLCFVLCDQCEIGLTIFEIIIDNTVVCAKVSRQVSKLKILRIKW